MFKSLKNFIGMGSADSENLSVDESNLKNQTDNSPNYSTKNNTIPTDKTQYLPKSSSYTSYFKNPFSNKQQKDKNKWGTESEDSQGDSNMGSEMPDKTTFRKTLMKFLRLISLVSWSLMKFEKVLSCLILWAIRLNFPSLVLSYDHKTIQDKT